MRKRISKITATKVVYNGRKRKIYTLENVKTFIPFTGMRINKQETAIIS